MTEPPTMTSPATAESIDRVALRAKHVRNYDPDSHAAIADHLGELADRRENCPMSFSSEGEFWVASSYDAISGVLRRSNRGFVSFPNNPTGYKAMGQQEAMIPIEIDGPLHAQYRKMLDPYFGPAAIAALEPQIRSAAVDLINAFAPTGTCDVVPEFAFAFPGTTFLAIMGWPLSDALTMNQWVETLLHGIPGGTAAANEQARAAAATDVRAYMLGMISERRSTPSDDLTTKLLDAEIDGERLIDDRLFDLFLLLMLAGLDTVQSVLAQSLHFLARNQDVWDEMFADPENLAPAVEEFLRWTSPAVPTRTVVFDSIDVGDLVLPKGERVHCPLAAANRDPRYYENPDTVDIARKAKPHVTFGLGPHRCLGVHLARLELRIAFEELRRRLPRFELDAACSPKEHLGLTWGVEDVRLTFPPS